jgi:hypothetical protein
MTMMLKFDTTYFFEDSTPTIVKKELSPHIVIDTIRNFIANQYEYTFDAKPDLRILQGLLNGFILFNLHKNKYMVKSKEELLKYVNDKSISFEGDSGPYLQYSYARAQSILRKAKSAKIKSNIDAKVVNAAVAAVSATYALLIV